MASARQPIRRRRCGVMSRVSAMNSGTKPTGSITTKSVTKALMICVLSMMSLYRPDFARRKALLFSAGLPGCGGGCRVSALQWASRNPR